MLVETLQDISISHTFLNRTPVAQERTDKYHCIKLKNKKQKTKLLNSKGNNYQSEVSL
jgi:hypothetical protein